MHCCAQKALLATLPSPWTRLLVEYSLLGHSLPYGLNAPPTASQAFVPGVANTIHNML